MTDVSTNLDWSATKALLGGLWPRWEPTEPERDLWAEKFRGLHQSALRSAMKEHKVEPTRPGVSKLVPDIGTILRLYHAERASVRGPRHRAPQLTDEEIADVALDVADMRAELEALPYWKLDTALTAAFPRYVIFKTGCIRAKPDELERRCADAKAGIPDEITKWPDDLVGFVWAALQTGVAA